jgi:hypothetical protein
MIRKGPFKYVYYAGMPPQLFDLDTDPQETRNLAREPGYQGLVADCEVALRRIVDPTPPMRWQRPIKERASPPWAGARRSLPAAASAIHRRREPRRYTTDLFRPTRSRQGVDAGPSQRLPLNARACSARGYRSGLMTRLMKTGWFV